MAGPLRIESARSLILTSPPKAMTVESIGRIIMALEIQAPGGDAPAGF